jgi:hypothetical protein
LEAVEPEESRNDSEVHPFNRAQQTVRGAAVELCILAMRWLSKDPDTEFGRSPRTTIETAHDLRSILESELADRSSSGEAGRAIMGRYLNLLYRLGEDWLRARLSLLLPEEEKSLRRSAWLAHLESDGGPVDGLIAEMAFCYADEIEAVANRDPPDRDAREHRLTDYLLTLQIRGVLPDDLLRRFLDVAPVGLRRDGMRLVGQTIGSPPDRCPPEYVTRAKSYWAGRLAAAKAARDPARFRSEIGAIGLWFLWIADVDWLTDQLLEVLAAGYAPNDLYIVIGNLAKLTEDRIERVVDVLYALATSPHLNRYGLMVQGAEMRRMLDAGKESGIAPTAAKVDRIVNVLASKGDDSYLDLLDHAEA